MNAVILAAGNSKRFGGNKLLHLIHGKPMYRFILEHISLLQEEGVLEYVVLVTQYEEIREYVELHNPRIQVIWNHAPEQGITSSIKLAMDEIKNHAKKNESCLFTVSDQPEMTMESLRGFIEAYENNNYGIGICGSGKGMGNPVIFHGKYDKELETMEGDKGGKQVVEKHLEDTFVYEIPEGELEDIDVRRADM